MKSKKLLMIILITAIAGAFAAYKFVASRFQSVNSSVSEYITKPIVAAFNRLDSAKNGVANYQHVLLKYAANDYDKTNDQLKALLKNDVPVLITIETLPSVKEKLFNSDGGILQQVANGDFDGKFKGLCSLLKALEGEVLVSINPDMEVYVNLYPWQMKSPTLYVNAFRHFSEIIKQKAPNVKVAWSPAGYPGTDEYWPGASFVDCIAVGLKSRSEMMTTNYPEPASQQIMFERKIERVRLFDKPILFVGSEKFGKKDFNQVDFAAAVAYIKENDSLLYMDAGIAEKQLPQTMYRQGHPDVGVFDPKAKLVNIPGINTEHIFVNLARLANDSFTIDFNAAMARNHHVIVTMEPWKAKAMAKDPNLLQNILDGKYDQPFLRLFNIIKNHKDRKVYLRFLHEMEIPITRYPWQSQDPVMYIKAYRYFVNLLKPAAANIQMVWGPAGDRGSMEFWPGSDVVDYVSMAIYGLPDKNITDHTKQESFSTIFSRKYRRINLSHKPLFITEFGVQGPEDYKRTWMMAAAAIVNKDSSITGINYFNFEDNPKAWGDIKAPDWSTPVAVFTDFVKEITGVAVKK